MTDRYIVIKLTDSKGSEYALLDLAKVYKSRRKAIAECARLNEVDRSINLAFTQAAEDRKKKP